MLTGLMEAGSSSESPPTLSTNRPVLPRRGAIGAISSAVSGIRAAGVIEIEPNRIRNGGLPDRIELDINDDAELRRSIENHGQQVPILVRPHPQEEGLWQVIFGRRRVQAAQELGIAVKALVRDLDDAELVMAQGQENSARRDLSFIEKANFAQQMIKAGYDRGTICDALTIDKTVVSRMLSTIERIPEEILRKIGAAHGVGRPRWIELADCLDDYKLSVADVVELLSSVRDADSNTRFRVLLRELKRLRFSSNANGDSPVRIKSNQGEPIAEASHRGIKKRLSIAMLSDDGFGEWLIARLPDFHAQWTRSRGDS